MIAYDLPAMICIGMFSLTHINMPWASEFGEIFIFSDCLTLLAQDLQCLHVHSKQPDKA